MGVGQCRAGEGRTMNSIAAGSAAHDDDRIARPRGLIDLVARNQAHAAAKHQRVSQVSIIEVDGAVESWDPHPVAIVAHACDDLLEDAFGMDDAAGKGTLNPRI